MAKYYYTIHSDTGRPLNNKGYSSINAARKDALAYNRMSQGTESIIIERNFVPYMFMADNGQVEYMDGKYVRENGPIMILNKNGSIKNTYYGRPKKKRTVKRR